MDTHITILHFASIPSAAAATALNEFFEAHDVTPGEDFSARSLVVADGSIDVRGQAINFEDDQFEELDRLAFEFQFQYARHQDSGLNGSEIRWTDGVTKEVGDFASVTECFDPVFSASEVLSLSGKTFGKASEILALLGEPVPEFVAKLIDRRESDSR